MKRVKLFVVSNLNIMFVLVTGFPASPNVPSQLPIQPDNDISYNPHPTPASESPQAVTDVSKTGPSRG